MIIGKKKKPFLRTSMNTQNMLVDQHQYKSYILNLISICNDQALLESVDGGVIVKKKYLLRRGDRYHSHMHW